RRLENTGGEVVYSHGISHYHHKGIAPVFGTRYLLSSIAFCYVLSFTFVCRRRKEERSKQVKEEEIQHKGSTIRAFVERKERKEGRTHTQHGRRRRRRREITQICLYSSPIKQ